VRAPGDHQALEIRRSRNLQFSLEGPNESIEVGHIKLTSRAGARLNRNLNEAGWNHSFGEEAFTKTFPHLP
jgi:hypothetical protein